VASRNWAKSVSRRAHEASRRSGSLGGRKAPLEISQARANTTIAIANDVTTLANRLDIMSLGIASRSAALYIGIRHLNTTFVY
jgi:hypothetical protein